MPTGLALIDDMNRYRGPAAAWWLGQHGFIFKLAGRVVVVDAYLAPGASRRVPPLLRPEELTNADIIVGTHDHSDHVDRASWPAMAAASPRAVFVVPEAVREDVIRATGIDASRFIGLDDLKSAEVAGVRLTGIAAAHELLSPDAAGRHPFLGVVIEAAGVTLYHAGDTCIYEGLATKLKRWAFDAVFLPINGRDAARLRAGCIGNMTYQEAADLAGSLRPRLTVPAHFEMFAMNSCDPALFIDYMQVKYPGLAARVPVHGERFTLA